MKTTETYNTFLYDAILEAMQEMDTSEIISMWNEYTDEINRCDDRVYSMDEFDEIMQGCAPWEIARACFYGEEFKPCDAYFYFNAYGNLESFDYVSTNPDYFKYNKLVDVEELIMYIMDENNALYNDDIQTILDDFEANEDENDDDESDDDETM